SLLRANAPLHVGWCTGLLQTRKYSEPGRHEGLQHRRRILSQCVRFECSRIADQRTPEPASHRILRINGFEERAMDPDGLIAECRATSTAAVTSASGRKLKSHQ